MMHAFPADELRPLTCDGRIKRERGDLDSMLGNYSMMLGRIGEMDGIYNLSGNPAVWACERGRSIGFSAGLQHSGPKSLRTLIDALDSLIIFKRKAAFKAALDMLRQITAS